MNIQIILLSGRSGSGKTSIANEMTEQLRIRDLPHAHIDGDNLDMIYPEEEGSEMLLLNLSAMWGNYHQRRNCRRLILSGTGIVLENEPIRETIERVTRDSLDPAQQADVVFDFRGFILTATDAVVSERLGKREIGSTLDHHMASSSRMASVLEREVGDWAQRVSTDDQSVQGVALQVLKHATWI